MSQNNLKDKPRNIYIRIFLVLTSVVLLVITVISLLLYINFESTALKLIQTYMQDNLSKASYSANLMCDSARMLTLQMEQDSDIVNLMLNTPDQSTLITAKLRMNSYLNTSPLIRSIYVYTGRSGLIYSTETNNWSYQKPDFFDKSIFEIIDRNPKITPSHPIPRTVHEKLTSTFEVNYNVYTFILSQWKNAPPESNNYVILNISEDWLRKTMNSLNKDSSSDSFIIDSSGRAVISTEKYKLLSDISGEKYIRRVLTSETPSGYFVEEVYGEKSLVSYASSDLFDWKFISVIPYWNVTKEIRDITRLTIIIASCILFLSFLLSYYLSKKLYKPINSIFYDLKKLEHEKKDNMYVLKQEFLRNIILSRTKYSVEYILGKFTDMRIALPPAGKFLLMLLKIDGYSLFCSENDCNDRNLLRFAISNIASELASRHFKNECVDMLDDHVVLILEAAGNMDKILLDELTASIQSSVLEYLHISLSIITTAPDESVESINSMYCKALDASYYRISCGHKCIINASEISKTASNQYVYPAQKEKMLINELLLGHIENVRKIYGDIIDTTDGFSYIVFNLTILHLAFSISTTIDTVEEGSVSEMQFSFDDFISKLNKFETISEINLHFYEMFESIGLMQEDRKNFKHDAIVNRVMEMINEKFMDQNLSIETIAPVVDMSPAYLGRIFKKGTSKSILQYMTDLRIDRAMQLLSSTNEPISEIAEKVGFINSSYFFTIFKKNRGITPSEYRHRSSNVNQ